MKIIHILLNFFHGNPADTADRICKILINHFLRNSNRLKNLCTLIRLYRGNSHLGSDLHNSTKNRFIIIIYSSIIVFLKQSFIYHFPYRLMRQIRIYRTGSISKQHCKMMNFPWFS